MTKQTIGVGSSANDKTGDTIRAAFQKVNANFTELYAATGADVQIPSQTGNANKYLKTDGTTLSWATTTSITNGGSNVNIATANDAPTITRGATTVGPTSYPAATWTFGTSTTKTLLIPGNITGPSQMTLGNTDGYGISIDSANTPKSMDFGSIGTTEFLRFRFGTDTLSGHTGDVEIQTIPRSGVGSSPTAIVLSPQGGQNGSFVFGGTGVLTLPTGGAINATSATDNASLFGNVTTGTISIGSALTSGSILIGTSNNTPQIAIGGGGAVVTIAGLSMGGPADKMWTSNYNSGTLYGSVFTSVTGTAVTGVQYYDGVTQLTTSGVGSGAQWHIGRSGGNYFTPIVYNSIGGTGYAVGDTVTIAGASLGGVTPTNNLTFTISTRVGNTYPIGSIGMIIYDSTINHFLGYVNNAWVQVDNAPASSLVNGGSTLSLGSNGNLTAPGNLMVQGGRVSLNQGGNAYIESVDYGVNSANSAVNIFGGPYQKIKLRAGFGTQATWTLGTDGSLTFPDATVQTTAYTGGGVSLGNFAFSGDTLSNTLSNAITLQVGGNNWIFGSSGQITFPDATVQYTAYQKVAVPAHSYGAAGDKAGMIAFDSTYIYYCTANYVNTSTNIWKRTAHGAGTW